MLLARTIAATTVLFLPILVTGLSLARVSPLDPSTNDYAYIEEIQEVCNPQIISACRYNGDIPLDPAPPGNETLTIVATFTKTIEAAEMSLHGYEEKNGDFQLTIDVPRMPLCVKSPYIYKPIQCPIAPGEHTVVFDLRFLKGSGPRRWRLLYRVEGPHELEMLNLFTVDVLANVVDED
ncbi:hypothetical protein FS749_008128 [Ceratobasidium sp. UAMH 11750]|nr:hypothetical protein FS749_008128 [Ceratobasidium sp. UAMH 11750]